MASQYQTAGALATIEPEKWFRIDLGYYPNPWLVGLIAVNGHSTVDSATTSENMAGVPVDPVGMGRRHRIYAGVTTPDGVWATPSTLKVYVDDLASQGMG
jgi:hypothetical protein